MLIDCFNGLSLVDISISKLSRESFAKELRTSGSKGGSY